MGEECGRHYTADKAALKSKSNHTVWNWVRDKAEKATTAKLQHDARNHLPNDQYDIEFINSSLPRKSRSKGVGKEIDKIGKTVLSSAINK